jgi:hypothetical protein
MATTYLLLTLLALHLISLVLMAGTTLIDFVTLRSFWKLFGGAQQEKAIGLLEATASFSRLTGIGAAVLIVTGLLMMVVTHGVFGEQIWFRIKFALVIILVANALFVGRRQGQGLRKSILSGGQLLSDRLVVMQKNLDRFYVSQLFIFVLIIFLSIFKFN